MKIIHAHFRIHYFWACLLVFCFGLAFPLAAQNNTASAYRQEHSRIKVFILPPWNLEQTGLAADAAGASGADAAGAAAGEAGDVAAAGGAVAGEAAAKEAEYQRILQSAVSSSLASAGFSRTDADDWRQQAEKAQSDDVFGALPLLAAREAYHDIALAVYYRIEEPRIFIMVKAYDVRRKRLIAAQVEIARSGLVLITAIDRIMESVVAELAVAADDIIYMQDNPGVATGTSAAKVVFVSKQEGMLLSIPGLGSVGAIQNGQAELPYQPLAMGQELEILKEAEGYYPQTQTFQIRDTFNQIYLKDLHPHSRHAAELNYNAWTALGLGLAYRYYFISDQTFVRGRYHYWLQPERDDLPGGAEATHHHDLSAEFGQYLLFPVTSRFRVIYNAGLGAILHTTPGMTAVDTYLNLAALTWEYNMPRWSLFIRQELRYSLPLFDQHFYPKGLSIAPPMIPLTAGVMFKWK